MEYWKEAGGTSKSLPGTSRAADRFVRTSFCWTCSRSGVPTYISGTPEQSFKFSADGGAFVDAKRRHPAGLCQ